MYLPLQTPLGYLSPTAELILSVSVPAPTGALEVTAEYNYRRETATLGIPI